MPMLTLQTENQKTQIGVIFVPVTGELYFSSKEMGAFKVKVDLENYDIGPLPFFQSLSSDSLVVDNNGIDHYIVNYFVGDL